MIDGGIIAFHDVTNFNGVKKVVNDYIYNGKDGSNFKNVGFIHSIVYAEKTRNLMIKDKIKKRISRNKRNLILAGYGIKQKVQT